MNATTEIEGNAKAELLGAAQALIDMVAAGRTVGPFHKLRDVIEIEDVKLARPTSPQAGRPYVRLSLCLEAGGYSLKGDDCSDDDLVSGFDMIKEIRSRIYDAAKVLKLEVARSKISARAFHGDPFNQTADYHGTVCVYLPVGVRS